MITLIKKIKDGIGFGIGLFLIFFIIIGVYGFIEPTIGPSNNYVFDWTSPFASKINDTNQKITQVQTTASGLSGNTGMYDNRIPTGSFPNAYTEVCYKSESRLNDQHTVDQSTDGGNCLPGDVGYIIEQDERAAEDWEQAKDLCLRDGMRLPEPFEYKVACVDAATFGLNSMTGNWEWASNEAFPMYTTYAGLGAVRIGVSGCSHTGWTWIGTDTGIHYSFTFRCVK